MNDKIKIKKITKTHLEKFISCYMSRDIEHGGFLIQNRRGNIDAFLPIPNISVNARNTYDVGNRERALGEARILAEIKKYGKVSAFWHSHPTPCIMSVADLSASGSYYPDLFFVTISPLDDNHWQTKYVWYACKGIRPVEIKFI